MKALAKLATTMTAALLWLSCPAADFTVDGINYDFVSVQGKTVKIVKSYGLKGEVTIPTSVQFNGQTLSVVEIGNNAFENNKGITTVHIPYIKKFGNYLFQYSDLEKVILSPEIKRIPLGCFSNCAKLSQINLENVDSVEYASFKDCVSLNPDLSHLTFIGNSAFSGCRALTAVDLDDVELGSYAFAYSCVTSIKLRNIRRSKDGEYAKGWFLECHNEIDEVEFGDDLTEIPESCFEYSGITAFPNGKNIQTIRENAFKFCYKLPNEIDIPASVTQIQQHAFFGLGSSNVNIINLTDTSEPIWLGTITMKEEGKFVEDKFYTRHYIITPTSWVFPTDVDLVYINRPFYLANFAESEYRYGFMLKLGKRAAHMENEVFHVENEETDEINYTGEQTYNLVRPFNNTAINGLLFDNDVTQFNFNCSNNKNLFSVELSPQMEKVIDNQFSGCALLTNLNLGRSLQEVGFGAFAGCEGIKTIKCFNPVPPVVKDGAWAEKTYALATLEVPEQSVEAYKNAPVWKDFWNIVSGIDGVKADENAKRNVDIHDMMGRYRGKDAAALPPGIYIQNGTKIVK